MKMPLKSLAEAIVRVAQDLPAEQLPALADAVIAYLLQRGQRHVLRILPSLVERAFYHLQNIVPVEIVLPSEGNLARDRVFVTVLEKAIGRTMEIHETADPSLIGGARIALGDERFDFSLATALRRVSDAIAYS